MDPKTKRLVEETEARAAKAQPGPWTVDNKAYRGCDTYGSIQSTERELLLRSPGASDADFEFAARARTDVPALCSAIREQDKRARHAEAERDAFGERIRELEAQLREAVELAAEAVPYVSDYFRDKYEMNDRLAKLTSDSPSPEQTLKSP